MNEKNFKETEDDLIIALNAYNVDGFISNLRVLKNKFNCNYELNQLKGFFSGNLSNIQRTKKLIYFLKKCELKTYKETDLIRSNKSYIVNVKIPAHYYKSQRFISDKLPSYFRNNAYFRGCGHYEDIIIQKPSRNEQILKNSKGLIKKTFTYVDLN